MFEMSAAQAQAFSAGAGVTASSLSIGIRVFLGMATLIWLLFLAIGIYNQLTHKTITVPDALLKGSIAAAVVVAIGSLIF